MMGGGWGLIRLIVFKSIVLKRIDPMEIKTDINKLPNAL